MATIKSEGANVNGGSRCVQRVVSWLRRIGHWLKEEESWSVLYPDGQLSRRMKRRDARAYKAIFGGSLVFRPRKPANDKIRRPGTVAHEQTRRRQPGSPASDC